MSSVLNTQTHAKVKTPEWQRHCLQGCDAREIPDATLRAVCNSGNGLRMIKLLLPLLLVSPLSIQRVCNKCTRVQQMPQLCSTTLSLSLYIKEEEKGENPHALERTRDNSFYIYFSNINIIKWKISIFNVIYFLIRKKNAYSSFSVLATKKGKTHTLLSVVGKKKCLAHRLFIFMGQGPRR